MIRGVHSMFYSSQPQELRAFLRDVIGLHATDVGEGWLIFDVPEADMGVHPTGVAGESDQPSGTHAISFYCDDIEQTVAEMKSKGAEFACPIRDEGYGLVTYFKVPGGFEIQLYQPHYRKGGKLA